MIWGRRSASAFRLYAASGEADQEGKVVDYQAGFGEESEKGIVEALRGLGIQVKQEGMGSARRH